MKRSPTPPADPGFGVEIRRGQRAIDLAPDEAPLLAPRAATVATSSVRRPVNRQQQILGGVLVAALLAVAALFGLSWFAAQPPGNVLARINGETISVDQVDKEILLNRAMTALLNGEEETLSRSATVESLIERRMQAQDATHAGVKATDAEVNGFINSLLERNGKTAAELETALTGYGLTHDDLYAEWRDVVQINSYIGLNVV
ncbi:MAG TPA: SurA N-terminal domain-containing protein, partial [Chloroflexia bacterium]|nr:SurA N-terminal domain-containing protein [Chloroflexia bacterium]